MNTPKAVRLSSLLLLIILLGGCSDKPSEPVSPAPPVLSAPVTVTMADGQEITVSQSTTKEEIAPYLARTYTAEEIEKLKMEEPYKSYLAEYQDKLLPQGSVVYITGADSLGMVISRNHSLTGRFDYIQSRTPSVGEKADYFLEKYPDAQGEAVFLKAANHQDIGLILHVGMESELEDRFLAGEMGEEVMALEKKNQLLNSKNEQRKDMSQYEYTSVTANGQIVTKKFPAKLLPSGSVVRVMGDKYSPEAIVVIAGRMLYTTDERQCVYLGYEYPEGINETNAFRISFKGIGVEEILHLGMESPEDTLCEAYDRTLIEYFMDEAGNY